MELSEHNWANISETVAPKCLFLAEGSWQGGLLDVVLPEYSDKSHNFRDLNFYDVITLELYWSSRLHLTLYTILI